MQIHGLNKTTLLDYPGHVAATIFLGSCNFRCPFCHNRELVLDPASQPVIELEDIIVFLKKRCSVLSGVCISGGEPTLHKELPDLIRSIKALGYSVKLDTNGTNPALIQYLYEHRLIDAVAMDIKACPDDYGKVSGTSAGVSLTPIRESVDYLMNCGIAYEFRTTVVKELHNASSFEEIGKWISGCNAYYLQAYRDSETVIHSGYHSCSKEELLDFVEILKPYMENVQLRGVD